MASFAGHGLLGRDFHSRHTLHNKPCSNKKKKKKTSPSHVTTYLKNTLPQFA